jgi:ribose 5-phosphate isomerase B
VRIAIASDHAGFQYKQALKDFLTADGHDVQDFGTDSEDAVDYPLVIRPAADAVARGDCERGIVLGGSGNGEAIVANRLPGVRCALCWNPESAELARRHNDANMISLGERLLSFETVCAIVRTWLTTPFDGERHLRRIQQIDGEA